MNDKFTSYVKNKVKKNMFYCGLGVVGVGVWYFYNGDNFFGMVGLLMGLSMAASGVLLHIYLDNQKKRLMNEGFCVDADFETSEQSVFRSKGDRRRGIADYIVTCSYADPSTGVVRFYISELIRLHFDPSFELSDRKSIKLYIDRNNPAQYYVDLDFLEELDKRRM